MAGIVWRWRAAPHSALALVGEKEAWFLHAIYCMAYPGARAKPSRASTAASLLDCFAASSLDTLQWVCSFLFSFTNARTFMCQPAASWPQPPRVASDRTVSVLLGPSLKRDESSPAAQQSRAKTHTFRG